MLPNLFTFTCLQSIYINGLYICFFLFFCSTSVLFGYIVLCGRTASISAWWILFSNIFAGGHLLGNLPDAATVRDVTSLTCSLPLSVSLTMQSNQFGCFSHLLLILFTFFCLRLQWLCFVAALRHGRPCAAFAVHCLLSNALDAEPSQSHEPHSTVR